MKRAWDMASFCITSSIVSPQIIGISFEGIYRFFIVIGCPKVVLELSAEEKAELHGFSVSRSLPHALFPRASLVPPVGQGQEQHWDRVQSS